MPCRQSLGARAARAARGAGDETRLSMVFTRIRGSVEDSCYSVAETSTNYNKLNCNDGFAVHQPAPPAKATKTLRILSKVATSLMQGQVSRLALNLTCPCHLVITCLPLAPNDIVIILRNLPILSHGH